MRNEQRGKYSGTAAKQNHSPVNGFSIMARKRRQPSDSGHVTCKHCWKDFRAITVFHLRNIHGYDGDHPINEYKHKFRLQSAFCLQSRKKISEAKEDFWAKRGQHWTPAQLLATIRRIHQLGRSLRRRMVPVRLYEAGRRLFGTWERAVHKAGLNYEQASGIRRWNRDKVIERIRNLAAEGIPLHASYIQKHYAFLYRAAVEHFPASWSKALRAAGFDPDEHKKPRGRWDEQKAENGSGSALRRGSPFWHVIYPVTFLALSTAVSEWVGPISLRRSAFVTPGSRSGGIGPGPRCCRKSGAGKRRGTG
jgi:hypothetical protein